LVATGFAVAPKNESEKADCKPTYHCVFAASSKKKEKKWTGREHRASKRGKKERVRSNSESIK
jgi:hypothetical protein